MRKLLLQHKTNLNELLGTLSIDEIMENEDLIRVMDQLRRLILAAEA